MRGARLATLLLLLLPLTVAPSGRAQAPGPDLNVLALQWALGDFRAPLVCELGDVPRRGLRRVSITPARSHGLRPANRLRLYDLDLPQPTRCYTETGRDEPNALGILIFDLDAVSRPDTALRDFRALLRREQAVEFVIRRGRLRLGAPGASLASLREVDFSGGSARMARIERGSDAFRRLADFGERRKMALTLLAPDGTRLQLELVEYDPL